MNFLLFLHRLTSSGCEAPERSSKTMPNPTGLFAWATPSRMEWSIVMAKRCSAIGFSEWLIPIQRSETW